jgi:hypothetical protein
MPSLKGLTNEQEVRKIASWTYDNFPKREKNCKAHKQGSMGKKFKKSKAFLINGMPHLTNLVKKHWDELNLTKKQKLELIATRKRTKSILRKSLPQIEKLEKEIKIETLGDKSLQGTLVKISKLAKLKAKLSKAQVKCIRKTKEILTPAQLQQLLNKK